MTRSERRKVCVVLVDRANYGRLRPVMNAIRQDADLELQTLCTGTMLLERFGQAEKVVEADGFAINSRVYMEIEGSVPATMAQSIGLGIIAFSNELQRLNPGIVLLIGDRYEALAAAIAASYMNVPVAHIQGGEISGSIDESARHAITKFAHLHLAATERAAAYIRRMGEDSSYVFNVGCPSGDYILSLDSNLPRDLFDGIGVGGQIDLDQPFLLVIFHPVTTEFGSQQEQTNELLMALHDLDCPVVWLWPNIDAGAGYISKAVRVYREHHNASWLHLVKNLEPVLFQKVLKRTACAIGNSSSFIRDSTFSGTPVVLVGDRQVGREHGENLLSCPARRSDIVAAVKSQLSHGRYAPSDLYGDGNAAAKIVHCLKEYKHYPQKRLRYFVESV